MATTLETRYTYYSRSGTSTPAKSYGAASTFNSDARGFLTISYALNSAKTAYTVTVVHKAQYYNNSEEYCYINATSLTSKVKIGDGSWTTLGSYSKSLTGTMVAGTKYTHTYGTKTFTVPVENDGSATFSLQCIFKATDIDYINDNQNYTSGGSQRTWTYNGYELPKVNVTSSITSTATSSASKQFGQSIDFTITRPNTSVTHTLTYKIGSTTYTIGSGITTSKSYTFPTSLINSFPNNATASIVVTCASSNGTSSTTTVYLTVPSSYVPTCSLAIEDVGDVPEDWGIWLKNISKIKGTITAAGTAGSTIKSYKSTANGSTYTVNPFETAVLKNSGSQNISSTVTDSRGRTASASKGISVVDYFTPSISSYSVVRCLENGTEDNEGTYGKVKCAYSIAPINDGSTDLNTKLLIVKYGDVTKTFELTAYSGSFEATDLFSDLSTASKHSFEFYLVDYFNPNGIPYNFDMSPSFTTISKLAGGKGVTFGQVATEEGFHSYMEAFFHKNLNVVDGSGNVQTLEDAISESIRSSILAAVYPVGSIYTSVNSTSPATLFGGTWTRIQGYFLLAANDKYDAYKPGATGGSVNHSHGYGSLYAAMANKGTSGHYYKSKTGVSFTPNEYKKDTGAGYSTTTAQTEGIQVYGTTGSADGMPPFLAVYIWKRTA